MNILLNCIPQRVSEGLPVVPMTLPSSVFSATMNLTNRDPPSSSRQAILSSSSSPSVPSLAKDLCRFQNVSGDFVLVSCTESRVPVPSLSEGGSTSEDAFSHEYDFYEYEHYNFTDEQWSIVRQLNLYYVPLLIIVGFVGNLLSCVVFLNTRLRMRSSSYYLAALAIADVTYLFILFLVWLDLLGFNTFNVNVMCQVSLFQPGSPCLYLCLRHTLMSYVVLLCLCCSSQLCPSFL